MSEFLPTLYRPSPWGLPTVIENESPETAIARQNPLEMLKYLEAESARRRYNEALAIGANVVNNYVGRLSSDELSKLEAISVEPSATIGGFLGLGGSRGMFISFKRK